MTPLEFCESVGGCANANKLRMVHNGKQVYIGTSVNGKYELNDLGKALYAEYNASNALGIESDDTPKKAKRKARKVEMTLDEDAIEVTPSDVDS